MDKKLEYAFTWLTSKKGEIKNLDSVALPMRDMLLDIKETIDVLYIFRRDVTSKLLIDTAISMAEKQYGVDLSEFKSFLSVADIDENGNVKEPKVMNCCYDELVNEER